MIQGESRRRLNAGRLWRFAPDPGFDEHFTPLPSASPV